MDDRFTRLPAYLAERARSVRLGRSGVPALLAHPDWRTPSPVVLWMHGRTVNKELDPGRYLRWIRAGIAACAIDLPGHGERLDEDLHDVHRTLEVLELVLAEIDEVIEALADGDQIPQAEVFDLDRLAIGGMSAGGMAALAKLCDPGHPFRCAAVEATTGSLREAFDSRLRSEDLNRLERLDPIRHLEAWRPLPLLVLHSEADRVVPFSAMQKFTEALGAHYRRTGADPAMIEVVSWPQTGSPDEHAGFGRFANDAKNVQVAFLGRHLLPGSARPAKS